MDKRIPVFRVSDGFSTERIEWLMFQFCVIRYGGLLFLCTLIYLISAKIYLILLINSLTSNFFACAAHASLYFCGFSDNFSGFILSIKIPFCPLLIVSL